MCVTPCAYVRRCIDWSAAGLWPCIHAMLLSSPFIRVWRNCWSVWHCLHGDDHVAECGAVSIIG